MLLDRFKQDPDETKVKTVDYSEWLQSGETINAVTVSVTPATTTLFTAGATKTNTSVALTTDGGEDGNTYSVEVTVTTSMGQVKEDCVEYIVEESC